MTNQEQGQCLPHNLAEQKIARRKRPAWRQRLVQAERGFVGGVRGDSVFFVHFFGVSLVVAAALVLGVGWMQWTALAGCLTLVLATEMINQALKTLVQDPERPATAAGKRVMAIGTGAVMVATLGSCIVLAIVFAQRIHDLFGS